MCAALVAGGIDRVIVAGLQIFVAGVVVGVRRYGPRPQRFAGRETSEIADDCRVVHPLRPGTGRAPLIAAGGSVRREAFVLHGRVGKMREFVGGEASAPETITKNIESILAAKDASEETKGFASYIQVMEAGEDEEKFQKLAEAHVKAFPNFEGNAQIEDKIKAAEMSKTLKEKPLELSFTSTDGKEVDMAKLRGKVVLIDFWATWCGPCVKEIPNVVATYNKLHDQGFEIVGISFDQDKDKLAAMTKDKKMPWAQYFDGNGWENKFGQLYGIHSIPAMWLIDKKGMLVDTEGREDLANKVAKLLAE